MDTTEAAPSPVPIEQFDVEDEDDVVEPEEKVEDVSVEDVDGETCLPLDTNTEGTTENSSEMYEQLQQKYRNALKTIEEKEISIRELEEAVDSMTNEQLEECRRKSAKENEKGVVMGGISVKISTDDTDELNQSSQLKEDMEVLRDERNELKKQLESSSLRITAADSVFNAKLLEKDEEIKRKEEELANQVKGSLQREEKLKHEADEMVKELKERDAQERGKERDIHEVSSKERLGLFFDILCAMKEVPAESKDKFMRDNMTDPDSQQERVLAAARASTGYIVRLVDKLKTLESERVENTSRIEELTSLSEARGEEIQRLTEEFQEQRAEFHDSQSRSEDKIVSLEEELAVVNDECQQLLQQVNEERERLTGMEDAYNTAQSEREKAVYYQKEIEKAHASMRNLEDVLKQYEQRRQYEYENVVEPLKSRVSAFEELDSTVSGLHEERNGLLKKLSLLDVELTNAIGKARNLESENVRLTDEVVSLRDSLEEAMRRLKNVMEDEQVVDRRIVKQLITAYISREHPSDVLELMCRMLQFDKDDREKIGMGKKEERSGGDGSGLSSRFVEFLLQESENDVQLEEEKNSDSKTEESE